VVRALIDWQAGDLLTHSRERLKAEDIRSVEDVRKCPGVIVDASPEVRRLKAELERFLHQNVYRQHRVMRMAVKGQRLITALFNEFCRVPCLLPERYSQRLAHESRERVVCDYLAGMTDRFARDEYLRLFQPDAPV
jgi:dGTPase